MTNDTKIINTHAERRLSTTNTNRSCTMIIQLAKSKTVWFSMLIMALGIIEVNFSLLQENLGEYYGISFMLISVVMGVLRMVTIKPITEK